MIKILLWRLGRIIRSPRCGLHHDWEVTGRLYADHRMTLVISETETCRRCGAVRHSTFPNQKRVTRSIA